MAYKPRILVVEKDAVAMRVMESTLKVMGSSPRCFSNPKDAAGFINKEKFDGAFLDWDTPELNGEQLTKLIRNSKSNAKIPIAMITGKNDTKSIARGFQAGVNFFLAKPIGTQELGKLLNATRGAMLEERRRYQRGAFDVDITVRLGDKDLSAHGINLSSEGILVSMSPKPEIGAGVRVELLLPGGDGELDVKGTVARHGPAGQVGIKFSGLSRDEKDLLKRFADRHQPGGPVGF
jgi:CheY-like chemotaxis protein